LCRAHIAAFARGAEKYAAETNLSTRVGQWQMKLLPLLDEEERRPVFDIHVYGETVVRNISKQLVIVNRSGDNAASMIKPPKIVAFRDITRKCPPFEVCRMFLAALSLNNSGNIQFTTESTLNALDVELLCSDIERPMETFLAPSVEEAGDEY
jgi:condensin-2 complex subunit H2